MSTRFARRTLTCQAWPTIASTGSAKPTITCRLVRPMTQLQAARGWSARKTSATTSRAIGGLDHIVQTGTIVEAVDNQPWSGEANVHVSIVDWVKTQDAKVLPEKRRLWFKVDHPAGEERPRRRGTRAGE